MSRLLPPTGLVTALYIIPEVDYLVEVVFAAVGTGVGPSEDAGDSPQGAKGAPIESGVVHVEGKVNALIGVENRWFPQVNVPPVLEAGQMLPVEG